jgi:Fur family transcriptional regulator, ferric uptake regulator
MVFNEKQMLNALREHGYKVTPQRRAIISVIMNSHEHLTPTALHERVIREDPSVGLVTIYRTIEILTELGFICEMHAGGSCRSYLMRRPSEHHHHLICSNCGKVIDFVDCDLDKLELRLSQENDFKISSHLLEFLGQCRQCNNAAKRKNKRKSKEMVGV